MTQLLVVAALALFAGSTLLLSHVRCFRRRPLADRLAPYVPGGTAARSTSILVSAETFGQVIGPLARAVGERVARAVSVTEPLAVRLERIGSPLDVTGFRARQLGWAAVGLVTGTVLAVATQLSGPLALLLIVTGPLIGFLMVEQRLDATRAGSDRPPPCAPPARPTRKSHLSTSPSPVSTPRASSATKDPRISPTWCQGPASRSSRRADRRVDVSGGRSAVWCRVLSAWVAGPSEVHEAG